MSRIEKRALEKLREDLREDPLSGCNSPKKRYNRHRAAKDWNDGEHRGGQYPTAADACAKLVRISETVEPEAELAACYEDRYQRFRQICPALKGLFPRLGQEG